MAHNISDKRAAFIGTNSDIWHNAYRNMIDAVAGKALRGKDLVELSGAGFNVFKVPMFVEMRDASGNGNGQYVQTPYGTSICRDSWGTYVAEDESTVVEPEGVPVQIGLLRGGPREKYSIHQNIETAEFFDELVDAGLMTYTGAAVLERGTGFFVAAKIADGVVRTNPDGSEDRIEGFGTIYNRHDGRSSATANWSATRVVCENTLRAALASGLNARIMHAGNMRVKFDEARRELAKGSEEFNTLVTKLRAMNAKKANKTLVTQLFEMTFPITKEGDKAEKTFSSRRLKQIAAMTDLMFNGLGNGAGTVYDWFNGVTQYLDHDDEGSGNVTPEVFVSSNFGTRANIRERAFAAAMKVAA